MRDAKRSELLGVAKRLCQQCEELRARAERVMQHSENLQKSHAIRRKLREARRASAT